MTTQFGKLFLNYVSKKTTMGLMHTKLNMVRTLGDIYWLSDCPVDMTASAGLTRTVLISCKLYGASTL